MVVKQRRWWWRWSQQRKQSVDKTVSRQHGKHTAVVLVMHWLWLAYPKDPIIEQQADGQEELNIEQTKGPEAERPQR